MKYIKYTEEEKQFLTDYIPGHHHSETVAAFSAKFRPILEKQVKAYARNHKILTGFRGSEGMPSWNKGMEYQPRGRSVETQFRPGHIPNNWKPIGSERIDTDGFTMVKVAEPNKWKSKQRHIWELINGPIDRSEIVIFLDGNKQNFDIDNLRCISRRIHGVINHKHLAYHDAQTFEVACLSARLSLEISEAKRRKSECKNRNHKTDHQHGG